MKALVLAFIRVYRAALSPFFGPCCRFVPSCSAYAEEAICEHGWLRGGRMALWRLARCHPLSRGGLDAVPPATPSLAGPRG